LHYPEPFTLFPCQPNIKVGVEIYVNQVYGIICRIYDGKDNQNELLLFYVLEVLALPLLIQKSWVVFVYAITISIESIVIEYLTTRSTIQVSPILLSGISITLSGIMLMMVTLLMLKKKEGITILFLKSWKNLLLASLFLSIGIFTWYDSINRIGAAKELLIAGPLEIVIIVLLARIFLREILKSIHIIGIALALFGFVLAIMSDSSISEDEENIGWNGLSNVSTLPETFNITIGDMEAILSAFGFALGVLFLTKLVSRHSSIEVASSSMLISGFILVGFLIVGLLLEEMQQHPSTSGTSILTYSTEHSQQSILIVVTLIVFSLLPFVGSLSYSTGLSRIGASLTATIGSSSILITLVAQLLLVEAGIPSNLPNNIFLAVLGGIIGFLGIYIIHMRDYSLYSTKS
jgi:drug/metabolite transporter (DMT)-like permease